MEHMLTFILEEKMFRPLWYSSSNFTVLRVAYWIGRVILCYHGRSCLASGPMSYTLHTIVMNFTPCYLVTRLERKPTSKHWCS